MKFILSLVAALNLWSTSAWAENTIEIATGEYPPYTGSKLYKNGFVCHVVTEAFKRVHYDVKYNFFSNWKRAYESTKEGKFQATAPWAFRADREQDFYFSQPIFFSKILLFHLKSNPIPEWNQLTDLRSYVFGGTTGYTYTEEFWNLQKSGTLTVNVVPTDEQNLKKLLVKHIDIFPLTDTVSQKLFESKFKPDEYSQFTPLSKPLMELKDSVIFPKSLKISEKMRETFDQGLQQIKNDGTYEKIHRDFLAGKYDN